MPGPPPTAAPRAQRSRSDGWSPALGVVALLGATIAALIIGITIVPMEAAHGRLFTDTPGTYQILVYALGATMVLWAALGVAALVTGIVSIVRRGANSRAVWGIILAVVSPFVAVTALIASMVIAAMMI